MLGIAFEGCAFKAAFHAGVAAALAERGLIASTVAGASSGALIAAGVAAGKSADLPRLWKAFGDRSIVSLRRAVWNRSLFDMGHLLRTSVTAAFEGVDFRAAPVEAVVSATRVRDLQPLFFSSREETDLIEPLLGSCLIPGIYGRPVRVRGELLIDGGVTDNLPLEALARRGATELIAVVSDPSGLALKDALRLRWKPTLRQYEVRVIHPRKALRLRSWDTNRSRLEEAVDEGYECGLAFSC